MVHEVGYWIVLWFYLVYEVFSVQLNFFPS